MSKQKLDFECIKREVKILDVARELGFELHQQNAHEWRGVSIAPNSTNITALSIDTDLNVFNDFKSNEKGSVLDFVALVKFGDTDKEAIYQAAEFLAGDKYVIDNKEFNVWRKAKEDFITWVKTAHERLMSDDTVAVYTIGLADMPIKYGEEYVQEPRIIAPYLDRAGVPFYAAHRRIDKYCRDINVSPKYKKLPLDNTKGVGYGYIHNGICGLFTLPERVKVYEVLVTAEGFFDFLSFAQEGFCCISPITGQFSNEQIEEAISICKRAREIITTFDNDVKSQAGIGFTIKFGNTLFKAGLKFSNVAMSAYGEGHKDISDYYQAGGDLNALVTEHTQSGAVFIAHYLNAEYGGLHYNSLSVVEKRKLFLGVREFLKTVKELLTEEEFKAVQAEIKKYLPEKKLEEALKEPSEREIVLADAETFLNEYPYLSFFGAEKHGTYIDYVKQAGVWQIVEDAQLYSQIFHRFCSSYLHKRVKNIADVIRMTVTPESNNVMPEFNKKQLVNMPDGTFELDTGIFREHRPEDMLTYCLSFNYDPKATCPMFDKMFNEVTAGEQSRMNHILDSWAYAYFSDCRYEKAFCWIGDGANGKSTLLKILEALFTNTNKTEKTASVTHVQPKDFIDATKRIQLQFSLLNIAYDIDSNLSSAESYIKSLTSGDRIDGNFKFKDTHSFQSRAKLFMATNETPIFRDTSNAIARRVMFCKFVEDFTGREDTTLADRIIANELPGIFNKVFKAYQELLQRGYIRESCDQDVCSKEMQEIANPILSFWHDVKESFIQSQWLFRRDVYTEYEAWCMRNHIKEIVTIKAFSRTFCRLRELKDLNKKIVKKIDDRDKMQHAIFTFAPTTGRPSTSKAEAVIQSEPSTSDTEAVTLSELSDTTANTQPEFSDAELEAIDACNKQYNREIVTATVKQLIHKGLQVRTFEHYMKFLTEYEALALEFLFNKLQKFKDAEIAQKIWTTKYNKRMSA